MSKDEQQKRGHRMNILKGLKWSPLGLDLYLWLTYRTFALKRPLRLQV